jgi:hypothetical protein
MASNACVQRRGTMCRPQGWTSRRRIGSANRLDEELADEALCTREDRAAAYHHSCCILAKASQKVLLLVIG